MLHHWIMFLEEYPLAVPLGEAGGLPLGVKVMAGRFGEDLALGAGEVIEAPEGPMRPVDPHW